MKQQQPCVTSLVPGVGTNICNIGVGLDPVSGGRGAPAFGHDAPTTVQTLNGLQTRSSACTRHGDVGEGQDHAGGGCLPTSGFHYFYLDLL